VLRLSAAGFALALTAVVVARGGEAAPPENADPALHGWFESLKQPKTGISCCSTADCRPVQYRLAPDGYEALLDARWIRVPADRILHQISNPTGRAILCRSPISGSILCFVPASEA
jgi:hypothetical protein